MLKENIGEGNISNFIYEVRITLIPKLNKKILRK